MEAHSISNVIVLWFKRFIIVYWNDWCIFKAYLWVFLSINALFHTRYFLISNTDYLILNICSFHTIVKTPNVSAWKLFMHTLYLINDYSSYCSLICDHGLENRFIYTIIHIHIMIPLSCSVCAMQNLLILLNFSWISA